MSSPSANYYLARRPTVLAIAKVLFIALAQVPFVDAVPHRLPLFHPHKEDEREPSSDPSLWLYLGVAAALVLLGGAFAGLTIALMGQDEIYLQVIKTSGDGAEKNNAAKVLKLLKRGKHWVLVTLLLSNVITNETLPIVLDRSLGGGWPAVLGSTVLIVIFGEIVPQSICVRYGLPIGAWMSPFVLSLMYVMAPIAWPTAKLLDYLLGEDHGTTYKKAGLKTLVTLHKTLGAAGEQLNTDEVTIISAVLDLKEKSVESIMTPIDDVFIMSMDTILDERTMDLILSQGYSRIPIHSPDNRENFVGMLLVKMLITYDPEDAKPVRDFALATLPETRAETSCLDIINFFQEGKSHMVLVSDNPGKDNGVLGVVTLEDVIEELIGEEIVDESDVFVDVSRAMRRMTPAPLNRARAPKGKVLTDIQSSEASAPENLLIDITENKTLSPAQLQRTRTAGGDAESPHSRAPPAFMSRRLSSTAGSDRGDAHKRAYTPEMHERLKHLGPSNPASKPKPSRQKTMIMKPGRSVSQSIEANGTNAPRRVSAPVDYDTPAPTPSVEALGGSLGKNAKDGVQKLMSAYGSMDRTPPRPSTTEKAIGAGQEEELPETDGTHTESNANGKKNNRSPRSSAPAPATSASGEPPQISDESIHSSSSHSTLRSLRGARSGSPQVNRGPARSGSITEHIIDVGGIKKVVLETTSSSSSGEDGAQQGMDGASDSRSRGGSRLRKEASPSRESSATVTAGGGGKKKKRRKKGRGGKGDGTSGETQPLLSR